MQIEIRELSPISVEVSASFPWDHVQKVLEGRFHKLARTAKLKGFRPGKVPVNVVKNLFRQQVESETRGELMEAALTDAVEKHAISLVAQPEVGPTALETGKPFSFVATCQVRPKIDKVVLDGIQVFRELDAVTDADVAAELESLRDQRADLRMVEPARPAQAKDVLTIDYAVVLDGAPKPEFDAQDRPVDLGGGRVLPEFEAALVGANVGDVRDAVITYAEDYGNAALRGKTATFSITVKEIKEKVLPDLDDEFAKDCGEESLAALQTSVRARLEAAAKSRSETAIKDQVVDALVEKNPLEVPPAMVQEQRQALAYEMYQISQMMGSTPPPEAMRDLDGRAARRVRAGLLLSAVARLEKLEVSPAEFEAKLAELAGSSGRNVAKLKAEYTGERKERLESQLLERKILDFVESKISIVDGKRPEAKAEG